MEDESRQNLRFNRVETSTNHYYCNYFYKRHFGEIVYRGYIKCKLIHADGFSLIVPDQLYLLSDGLLWIQPITFTANVLSKYNDWVQCKLYIDISFGNVLEVTFLSENFIRSFADGSQLFHCEIKGPEELDKYATGEAELRDDNIPYIRLYHHTSDDTRKLILTSGFYKPSFWNIQGTKRLENIGYVYFTCLDEIKYDSDLEQIAMASKGLIAFRLDQNPGNEPDCILEVYRDKTLNRRATIMQWVDTTLLASQPIFKHSPSSPPVYYEVVQHFTFRIGIQKNSVVNILGNELEAAHPKNFRYLILGDATTLDGLKAPFDEEDTSEIFKIEYIEDGSTLLDFWFDHSNKDLFSIKTIEYQEFEGRNSV